MSLIQNPILRGFNADPSIIRVEDTYYIANSTFEWFPGVRLHESKDLKNWNLPGWAVGASYAYAWDAKPADMATPDAYYDPNYRLKESSYSLDAIYTLQLSHHLQRRASHES